MKPGQRDQTELRDKQVIIVVGATGAIGSERLWEKGNKPAKQ